MHCRKIPPSSGHLFRIHTSSMRYREKLAQYTSFSIRHVDRFSISFTSTFVILVRVEFTPSLYISMCIAQRKRVCVSVLYGKHVSFMLSFSALKKISALVEENTHYVNVCSGKTVYILCG